MFEKLVWDPSPILRRGLLTLAGILCASLLGGIAGPATALPLAVTESGDFSGGVVGTLDVGVNTITGDTTDGFGPDADPFSVNLPIGLSIVDISIAVSSYSDGVAGSSTASLVAPSTGAVSFNGDGTFAISPFTLSPEVASVDFLVSTPPAGETPGRDTFSYVLSVTVVPEPATGVLVTLGLAGMALTRGRRAVAWPDREGRGQVREV